MQDQPVQYAVRFLPDDKTATVQPGCTVLEAAQSVGVAITAPCGGKGNCKKCRVEIDGDTVFACQTHVDHDMTVAVPQAAAHDNLLVTGAGRQVPFDPFVAVEAIDLPQMAVGEYENDSSRLLRLLAEAIGAKETLSISLDAVRELEAILAQDIHTVNAVVVGNEVVHVSSEPVHSYMAAFDIGTTSLVGYLMDAEDGSELAVTSRLNPQGAYGADVISRANYAVSEDHERLTQLIRGAISEMAGELAKSAGIDRHDIYAISIVGNTCMHHLFLGILPGSLLRVPYNTSISSALVTPADALGIELGCGARVLTLPLFAGFVGADTNGCLLATDFAHIDKRTLMVDIGTNGELVLGDSEHAFSTSTAAGPALEGAKISQGMRGATGAIDYVKMDGDEMVFSVIGGGKAVGICGSGLIDLVAVLVKSGLVEPRGRFRKAEKLETSFAKANAWRLGRDDDGAFVDLVDGVRLTQKDIREVQLAKSAICVGARILSRKLGWEVTDIDQVLLAGAFGSYMDPDSACTIGLIPKELEGRVRAIGNAAGEGAKIALLDKDELSIAGELGKRVPFVELASEDDFQTLFVKNLDF